METDRRPSVKDLSKKPIETLRQERASLPTDDTHARVEDLEMRDRYNKAVQIVLRENEELPNL